jgi:cyclin-dependent kinase-like
MQKNYEVIGVVGEGAYGIVYKCKNKETGKLVAIKKFKEIEDKLVQKTMKRELNMLRMLKHDNIVDFQDAFIYKGNLFLVFEFVEKNLLEVLEKSPDGLSPKLIRSFVFQMCKAVHYLHTNNMIHRDVKPENLLIDENMQLKLCDFGFARKIVLDDKNNNIDAMTDYVATRWYRSPELLLSNGIYGPEVDYWAIGCIMGELADGNPMFPGENEVDQIDCIIKVLGNLPPDLVNMFYENPIYEGKELLKVNRPESLERRYRGKLGPTAIDFLKGLLQLDPNKRINDETVFKHKYFSCFMNEPENQYILDLIDKGSSTNRTNITKIDIVKKAKSNIEIDDRNNKLVQPKVINNTTNINIINYNNYNSGNNHNNDNENENSIKKVKEKLETKESKKNIALIKNNA